MLHGAYKERDFYDAKLQAMNIGKMAFEGGAH